MAQGGLRLQGAPKAPRQEEGGGDTSQTPGELASKHREPVPTMFVHPISALVPPKPQPPALETQVQGSRQGAEAGAMESRSVAHTLEQGPP